MKSSTLSSEVGVPKNTLIAVKKYDNRLNRNSTTLKKYVCMLKKNSITLKKYVRGGD
jgi:hypothetical protein